MFDNVHNIFLIKIKNIFKVNFTYLYLKLFSCPAKGKIILPHMETLWLYKSHKHCNKNKKLLATFRRTLIDRATREQTNHRVIFNEVCARPEFRSVNVPYTKFKRHMSKTKKENLPPEPNSMSAFKNHC